ncbi:MAG: adenylosuccinate synthetase [Burkholderiales bacterium]|nr:adenylosuccinate synthetase [Burkholderiales bacterium]
MPISIVVGGQFGSEGKGKVACYLAETQRASVVVRVGGPNSGHTVVDRDGRRYVFRQLPTSAVLPGVTCVIAAGSYVDPEVLLQEIELVRLVPARLKIDPKAVLITEAFRAQEGAQSLRDRVGSTLTGTGAAVSARINRLSDVRFAKDEPRLKRYIADTAELLHSAVGRGERVVAEGSQGFGLSVIHSPHFPFVTSRDTTAAGVLSEIGLSPLLVDDIALVIRAFPIRVPGNSGPLPLETSWDAIAERGQFDSRFSEMTSVTQRERRVAEFDADIVRAAIRANAPTKIFLNHVDYADRVAAESLRLTPSAVELTLRIQQQLGRKVDYIGLGPSACEMFGPMSRSEVRELE